MQANILNLIISLNYSFTSELNMEKLMQHSINEIVEKLDLLGGILFMVDGERIAAHTIAGGEIAQRFIQYIGMPIDNLWIQIDHPDNLIARSVREEKVFHSNDLKDFTAGVLSPIQANFAQLITQTKSAIVLPLISRDEVIGAIFLSSQRTEVFPDADEGLRILAGSLGIAIKNALLFKQLEENRDKLKATLAEVNHLRKTEKERTSILIHNLRNPLTAVLSATDMLRESLNEPRNIQLLDIGYKALNNIIGILDHAYIDIKSAKKEKIYSEQIKIHEALDEIIATFASAAATKGLKYLNRNQVKESHTINTDRLKFNQIFENLISNAIKYTPKGTVTISARVVKKTLIVEIKDTGMGIKPSELKQVGKKFYRANGSLRTAANGDVEIPEGSGLGIYAVRKYLEVLNGSLSYTSKLSEGTIATVELPL
jgi:signal transduction histidine kinase